MATIATLSKTRSHAAGSPRRHPQLLPHQSTLRNGGSHQRQHQNPSEKGPRLQESGLSAAQGPTHGNHKDRIHRPSESRLKCGSLQILVQSRFYLLDSAPRAEQDLSGSKASSDLWLCPKCGGPMMVIERLTAAEIQLRSPPPRSPRPHETTLYHKKSLRVSARSVSLRLAIPQTAPFRLLKPCLRESFALSWPFHPLVS